MAQDNNSAGGRLGEEGGARARRTVLGPDVDGRGTDAKGGSGGNVRDRDNDRAGGGGAVGDTPGMPGGTLGTGNSTREQDR